MSFEIILFMTSVYMRAPTLLRITTAYESATWTSSRVCSCGGKIVATHKCQSQWAACESLEKLACNGIKMVVVLYISHSFQQLQGVDAIDICKTKCFHR